MSHPPPSRSIPATQPSPNSSSAGPRLPAEGRVDRGRLVAIRDTASAALGVILGVVPHVLHHVALIAGTALVTGAGGNTLFFLVGLLFSVPMLRRVYRRFHSWVAPAIAVAVFAALFSLSALVIGPAISGASTDPTSPPAPPSQTTDGHSSHH